MMMFAVASLGLALSLLVAANATPIPIDVPPPEDCRAAPRPIAELAALGALVTPVAISGVPDASPARADIVAPPQSRVGYPQVAEEATSEEVVAVIREFGACINA